MMPNLSPKINKTAIEVNKLTVNYGDFTAVKNISFDLNVGEIAAIIGPNGSGKSTIVKAILGLVPTSQGEIKIFGADLKQARGRIGYVPQRFNFEREFPMTVTEFIKLSARKSINHHQLTTVTKDVGLSQAELNSKLGTLSGGQLQRVLIAAAMIHKPEILFLDEPGTGIDVVGESTFYELLAHLNQTHQTTIVIVSHDLAVVSQLVDKVICVNRDLICVGSPQSALNAKTLNEIFGHEVNFYDHAAHRQPRHHHHHHDQR